MTDVVKLSDQKFPDLQGDGSHRGRTRLGKIVAPAARADPRPARAGLRIVPAAFHITVFEPSYQERGSWSGQENGWLWATGERVSGAVVKRIDEIRNGNAIVPAARFPSDRGRSRPQARPISLPIRHLVISWGVWRARHYAMPFRSISCVISSKCEWLAIRLGVDGASV